MPAVIPAAGALSVVVAPVVGENATAAVLTGEKVGIGETAGAPTYGVVLTLFVQATTMADATVINPRIGSRSFRTMPPTV